MNKLTILLFSFATFSMFGMESDNKEPLFTHEERMEIYSMQHRLPNNLGLAAYQLVARDMMVGVLDGKNDDLVERRMQALFKSD